MASGYARSGYAQARLEAERSAGELHRYRMRGELGAISWGLVATLCLFAQRAFSSRRWRWTPRGRRARACRARQARQARPAVRALEGPQAPPQRCRALPGPQALPARLATCQGPQARQELEAVPGPPARPAHRRKCRARKASRARQGLRARPVARSRRSRYRREAVAAFVRCSRAWLANGRPVLVTSPAYGTTAVCAPR